MSAASTTTGCVCEAKGAKPKIKDFKLRDLGVHDVEVDIEYSGVCQNDLAMINNEWGLTAYPLVPGHEGVGKVVAIGIAVYTLKVGQRVGVSIMRDSCGTCYRCLHGEENICVAGYVGTCMTTHTGGILNTGTLAKKVRINERFCFPIPEKIDASIAAPLLCDGMIAYQPLRQYANYPGCRVAVIGNTSAGRMAIKMARAMGCEVTLIAEKIEGSGEDDKASVSSYRSTEKGAGAGTRGAAGTRGPAPAQAQQKKASGANNVVLWSDEAAMKRLENTLDLILDTLWTPVNYQQYLGYLRVGGVFCLLGRPLDSITLFSLTHIFFQKTICASFVSGTHHMCEMLNFAAVNHIIPECETWDFKDIGSVFDRIQSGKARSHIVLKW